MTALPNFADAFVREADLADEDEFAPTPAPKLRWKQSGMSGKLGQMRTSIAGKVRLFALSFTLLLTLLGAVLCGALAILSARSGEASVTTARALAASQLETSIAESRYFASRYAAAGDPKMIAMAFETLRHAHEEIDAAVALEDSDSDSGSRERMEWLATQAEGFEPELRALNASITANGPSATGDALANAIDISGSQLARQAAMIGDELTVQSDAARAALNALKLITIAITIALTAGCIVLVQFGARSLARQVSESLGDITGVMTRLAGGDRAVRIPGTEREDEIGEMARALVVFRESAEALADHQRKAREDQNALLQRLSGGFEGGIGEVVGDVSSASRQLQATSSAMAGAATQAVGFVEHVSQTMRETASGVTAAAAASDQFAMSIAEIGRQAGHSAQTVQIARSATERADARMAALSSAADDIGAVVQLIESIAVRTNLLALNASIEAARGGEAGRGFAVVASEVKELARQTREATGEVAARIADMQVTTRESAGALAEIGNRIREVEMTAIAIAQAVDEQSLSSRELARNLDMAANGVERIGDNISQIRDMAHDTGAAAEQVLESANHLDTSARTLDARSSEFVASVRAA
ncbi:MAG: HAMP domain-containing methyl-accepting chemotaxis protein [Erythrobacter sp.]|jgi:methyl-accepting chemotaxis protein